MCYLSSQQPARLQMGTWREGGRNSAPQPPPAAAAPGRCPAPAAPRERLWPPRAGRARLGGAQGHSRAPAPPPALPPAGSRANSRGLGEEAPRDRGLAPLLGACEAQRRRRSCPRAVLPARSGSGRRRLPGRGGAGTRARRKQTQPRAHLRAPAAPRLLRRRPAPTPAAARGRGPRGARRPRSRCGPSRCLGGTSGERLPAGP